jgi:hypothetical protein
VERLPPLDNRSARTRPTEVDVGLSLCVGLIWCLRLPVRTGAPPRGVDHMQTSANAVNCGGGATGE